MSRAAIEAINISNDSLERTCERLNSDCFDWKLFGDKPDTINLKKVPYFGFFSKNDLKKHLFKKHLLQMFEIEGLPCVSFDFNDFLENEGINEYNEEMIIEKIQSKIKPETKIIFIENIDYDNTMANGSYVSSLIKSLSGELKSKIFFTSSISGNCVESNRFLYIDGKFKHEENNLEVIYQYEVKIKMTSNDGFSRSLSEKFLLERNQVGIEFIQEISSILEKSRKLHLANPGMNWECQLIVKDDLNNKAYSEENHRLLLSFLSIHLDGKNIKDSTMVKNGTVLSFMRSKNG